MAKTDRAKAKERAWNQFSKYIRLKDADENGWVHCYTCTTVKPWKELHAGHGIGGRGNAILFDERLVKPQCVGCNIFAGGRYAVFTRKLIDELGLDGYDELVRLSNTTKPMKEFEFKEIEEKYKKLVSELDSAN